MIFFDTETVGLTGPIVLLQYAEGVDGEIKLYSPWKNIIWETKRIIEKIISDPEGVVGFNLAFDHFHLCQMYTTLLLMDDEYATLEDCIEEYALKEPQGRFGPCLKPVSACDLMLHARKGPYQSTMEREDIRIKRVPTPLAWQLAAELEQRVKLKDIYFARRQSGKRWNVYDLEDRETGRMDPNFKDVVLKFGASSALKALATDALGLRDVLHFTDVEPTLFPEELGYAPFALAIGRPGKWNGAWPDVIKHHINHWTYHKRAREYASLDVEYLQKLYPFFGSPELGDDDSVLACMVGAVRWRGFSVDIEGLKKLKKETQSRNVKYLPEKPPGMLLTKKQQGWEFKIPTAPVASRKYIEEVLGETEKEVLDGSTKKQILEALAKWADCPNCKTFHKEGANKKCPGCQRDLIRHPAGIRAEEVLLARQANYESDFYDKLILAGRFHASVKVIGALSGRMSGADGLNPQGIKRTKEVRQQFTLADEGFILCGGDFSGFEVCLAEAVYNDPGLRQDLLTGKKIHALFGQFLFPDKSYDDICKSAGTAEDFYDMSKRSFFSTIYGGTAETINTRVGIPLEDCNNALYMFGKKYPKVGEQQASINEKFCSMRQPGGIGTRVEWHEPADYIESMFGFRRYFTLENMICKALFILAEKIPQSWHSIKIKVQRRDRIQTATGAAQSALFAAAFALQAANMRAAKNHVIQSSGAQITKSVQRKIWDLQPSGIHDWLVQPLNIHDEIQCPTAPMMVKKVASVVKETVESYRSRVPLIKMDWQAGMKTWAEK